MPVEILEATVSRIAEHVSTHRLPKVKVILHGGEPLLAGPEYLGRTAALLRGLEREGTQVELTVQTNGVLLDEVFLEVFHRHQVHVGVSLDGSALTHDLHRRRTDGRGSHSEVLQALRLLNRPRHRPLFSGLLGVIDLAADPLDYYRALVEHRPPRIDLLLPHGSWSVPPPGLDLDAGTTPYADWLIRVFDRWYDAPQRETGIRFFESILQLLLGGPSCSEALGLTSIDLITVEADGTIEQVDSLKVTEVGAAATGLNVVEHSFDTALHHPGIAARQAGVESLAEECRRCPIVGVCGGGMYTHRHRVGSGFRHPSVYCRDLYRLITHVRGRLRTDLVGLRRAGRSYSS